jgi:hypothetical protein
VPRKDEAEATDWTLELIVLVAPAPPPLRLRLELPEATEMAAAMLREGGVSAIACGNVGTTVIESVESQKNMKYLY